MNEYELVLVLDPDLTEGDRKKEIAKVNKIIEELKGKVEKTDEWGQKELAYPIKKKNLGYYFLLDLKLSLSAPAQIDGKLKLEEGIIRYLLVKKE